MRKLAVLAVALVGLAAVIGGAGGALIAGSGSVRSSPSRPRTTVVTTVVTTNTTAGGGAAATPTEGAGAATSRSRPPGFLARCVATAQAGNTLYPAATVHLEAMCQRLASGDHAAKRSVRKELCIALVNNLHAAGAARARDLAICHAPS
jgi:hypothetical protein